MTVDDNSTNNNRKQSLIGYKHYAHTSEQDVCLLFGDSDGSANYVSIGGGTTTFNAATEIRFYVAGC